MYKNDEIILNLLKKGDKKGLEMLFDEFYRPLVVYAYKFMQSKAESEDVVQEVFIKLWETKHLLNINSSIRLYMYQSVKNASINWLKSKSRLNTEVINEDVELTKEALLDESDWNEYIEEVHKKIEKLPSKTREVFKTVVIENKKYKEAASDLGISVNTVKTVMARAVDTLRTNLKKGVYTLFSIFI